MTKKIASKFDFDRAKRSHKYWNTEKGFLTNRIKDLFAPSKMRSRGLIPECTKEEVRNHFFEYVDKYERNCFYCREPWTYIVNMYIPRNENKRKKKHQLKNFSIDRLDSSKTYSIDNIIFCCVQCNISKKDVSIKLIKRLYEIITERNL
jgi:5-methylcytosine-specific restriction endonuclease McrA